MERTVDAVIVGGGPCGLALAVGLEQQGYSVAVIEKEPSKLLQLQDWSKAYSFRVDVRGISLLKRIGLYEKLVANGVKSEGFKGTQWMPDGSLVELPPRTLGSVGYWIMRPQLMQLLNNAVSESSKLQGEVDRIEFGKDGVKVYFGSSVVKATYLFGCDGIRSTVRSTLAKMDGAFQTHKIDCLSAGIVFRASLFQPPKDFDPHMGYRIVGRSGDRLSLLPFPGQPGEPRPFAVARETSFRFFQLKTPEELYKLLDEEFPQMEARQRLTVESARAFCETEGSVFPKPRWSGKAATVIQDKVVAVILGDALHTYPPDLGQGLNSGMVDVGVALDLMEDLRNNQLDDPSILKQKVSAMSEQLTKEAEAVCRLLPIGMPYQYSLPKSIHKVAFFAGFLTRLTLHRLSYKLSNLSCGLIPTFFYAPVILEIQDDPPKSYAVILQHHRRNSLFLSAIGVVLAGITWRSFRSRSP